MGKDTLKLGFIMEPVDAKIMEGLYYYFNGNYNVAMSEFTTAAESSRKNTTPWYYRRKTAQRMFRDDEVSECVEHELWLNSKRPEAWVAKGKILRENRKFKEALKAFRKAIGLYFDYRIAWLERGKTYVEMGETKKATQHFQKLISTYPDDTEALYQLGQIYLDEGKFKEAFAICRRALGFNQSYYEAWLLRARIFKRSGKLSKAEECLMETFERQVNENCENASDWYNLGVELEAIGKDDEALETYTAALDYKPKHVESWLKMGGVYARRREYSQATLCLREVVAYGKLSSHAHTLMGEIALLNNRIDHALSYAEKAIAIDDIFAKAWILKSRALKRKGSLSEAITCQLETFQKLKDNSYSEARGWFELGVEMEDVGKDEKALEAYTAALDYNPGHVDSWLNMGRVYLREREFSEASVCLKKALSFEGNSPSALCLIGELVLEKGWMKQASSYAEKCIALDMNHTRGWLLKARALKKNGDIPAAVDCLMETFQRMAENEYSEARGWFEMGMAMEDVERNEEGMEAYTAALDYNPCHLESWLSLGRVYVMMGEFSQATLCIKEVLSYDKNSVGALCLMGKLALGTGNIEKARSCADKAISMNAQSEEAQDLMKQVQERSGE